jgi:hypothetical protein
MNVVLNWQLDTATLVLEPKETDPVPACTVSSKETTMAVLGGIILELDVGNRPVTAAGVPVVLCKGPVLSVEEVLAAICTV